MFTERATRSRKTLIQATGIGLLVLALVGALAVSAYGLERGSPAGRHPAPGETVRSVAPVTMPPGSYRGQVGSPHLQRQGIRPQVGVRSSVTPSIRPQVGVRSNVTAPLSDRPGSYRGHVGQLYLQRQAADDFRDRLRTHEVPSRLPSGGVIVRRPGGDFDHHDGDRDHDRDGYHDKILRHDLEHRYPVYGRYVYPRTGSTIIVGPGVYYRTYGEPIYIYPQPQTYVEAQPYAEPYPAPAWPERLAEPVDGVPADHGAAASADAWALLRQGNATDALALFSRIAQVYRGAGVPQIGSAVSLAMLGEASRGAWNMRRAVRLDPAAVAYTPRDDEIRATLQRLVLKYRQREQNAVNAKDAAFMLAALHAMLDETDAAHAMIDVAIEVGDTSEGAAALKQFLDAAYPLGEPQPIVEP